MNNLIKKFDNFISNNLDLILSYESQDGIPPIESCKDDVIAIIKKSFKKNKTIDVSCLLVDSLTTAIASNTSFIDAVEYNISIQQHNSSQNSLQQYFKEVNEIYKQHDNKYDFEYIPENRDKLISVNLKSVIAQAKHYQGLGLSLQELISAGNLGLVIAWNKFDPSRAKLKDNMLAQIDNLPEVFNGIEVYKVLEQFLQYGDIKKKIMNKFDPDKLFKKIQVIEWIDHNIHNAKFSSIATMWIRAYILIEIDNFSRIVKKPKSEIYKDREKFGSYKKEITVDIDAPISEDGDTQIKDLLNLENDDSIELDSIESYDIFRDNLNKLMTGVKSRDKSIFLKKFGIGVPRPMSPKELAESEGLSIARISQIFQTVIDQIQKNTIKYNIDPNQLFELVKKIK